MIAANARGAWRELEVRLRPYVARRVAPPDVDDVVQDVFERIHRGIGALRDDESFGGWVYRIAQRAVADHLRARARRPVAVNPPLENDEADDADGLEAELAECVALFVAQLPSPYREAVTLAELNGVTQREAARMLGISVSGMKSRVQRGRERIRRMFEQCCEVRLDARGHVVQCTPRAPEEVPSDCRAAAEAWARRK